ncbi:uncharacterized protein LOC123551236 [Mercenaria mercenaria]|uniref:uncharacterized protein LOC123551236 n=1 Tax=Mercenaria mercenaria TaxID=6596 RepID=UPI00234EF1A8|nr:uncharacterized protein LOC123551236 [Mercenaria mercenaria]XP_053396737.1 uncharacterized protein LOC123551236 [Mercenaria mercenaria]
MSEPEKDPLQGTNITEQTSRNWVLIPERITKRVCIIRLIVVASLLLIALVIALVIAFSLGHKDETIADNNHVYPSMHKGDHSSEGFGVTDDLIINSNVCSNDKCILFKTNVISENIPYGSLSCDESNGNIRNSSCYLCNNTCTTIDDLIHMKMINCINSSPTEINCCLIAQMANLNRMTEGKYRCYSASVHEKYNKTVVQPLLQCPFGWKGEQCQEQNTEPFVCKCFKYKHKFIDQEKLTECNEKPKTRTERISTCFMSKNINGVQHNCLCSNTKVAEAKNLDSSENQDTQV